jgi:hypothetical protein
VLDPQFVRHHRDEFAVGRLRFGKIDRIAEQRCLVCQGISVFENIWIITISPDVYRVTLDKFLHKLVILKISY